MKKDKSKSKSHETNIGKIIYGFLLFMPLLAIAVTCGYAIFNKNAYQSYTKEETLEQYKITNNTTIVNGQEYTIKNVSLGGRTPIIYSPQANDICLLFGMPNTYNYIGFRLDIATTGNKFIYGYNDYTTSYIAEQHDGNINWFQRKMPLTFTITDINTNNNSALYQLTNIDMYWNNYTSQTKLDQVFYQAINKIEQSNLFNWAQNSIVYTTLTATCTALSINNTFIPLLLAYWLIISVIYILYDIALVMLMIFHRKVHELQECIW